MATQSPQPKGCDHTLPALDALIQILEVAKVACVFPPAQVAIGSTSALLTIIKDSMASRQDFVELGKSCGRVCQALDRGLNGKRSDELNPSVLEAIGQLTETVAEIQRKMIARGKRNPVSRALYTRKDKDEIVVWGRNLDRILNIFNTELSMNNHTILLDIRRDVRDIQPGQGGNDERHSLTQVSTGELPPPPPRACFGRDELIENIVSLVEHLQPIALIGPGGIGKTSIALAVLHSDRTKDLFGDSRRFLRCDQFTASPTNFLTQLSKVIGAGVENLEALAPLRPFLPNKLLLILDNAESILDPQGTDGRKIYGLVEELSQLDNVCLCITSRITIVPPDCKRLDVPTLSLDAARSTFYRIYDYDEPSGHVDDILEQLDFHPLSVTLMATVARQNKWGNSRLVEEWTRHQTGILQTEHNKNLAATIELSLASPMFRQLGPDAQGLLGVVAFFPQGIHERNLNWLFSTISNRKTIFDTFCILSLTYRSNDSITMLAPLRDYLHPKDPKESILLSATKDLYLTRLSAVVDPEVPGFEEARWITSEDANVEHLLDVFSSVDPNSEDIWDGCDDFMRHLYWHKPRQTVLRPKIQQLTDGHPWKPRGLLRVAGLLNSVGNPIEEKRLLAHALKLWRERGSSDYGIAITLWRLSQANRLLGLREEGIPQAEEALRIFERRGDTMDQAGCLSELARSLIDDKQLDAAEEATIRSINLLGKGQEFQLCESHRTLGQLLHSKGEIEKAIHEYNVALGIADPFNWHDQLFWIHHDMARLFRDEDEFDDAHAHIKKAKEHALYDKYYLGRAMEAQARIWYRQWRDEDAVSEASRAIEVYEKLGAVTHLERCTALLRSWEEPTKKLEPN